MKRVLVPPASPKSFQLAVHRCVATLRTKIEPDPHTPSFIHTIRDIGYRFEAGEE